MKSVASFLVFTMLFLQCASSEDINTDNPVDIADLNIKKQQILNLINSSDCTGSCNFIAFGSKPCGGPWEYLLFPSSIDINQLEQMVSEYNAMELQYNIENNVMSDCAFVLPPDTVNCVDGQCIVIN